MKEEESAKSRFSVSAAKKKKDCVELDPDLRA